MGKSPPLLFDLVIRGASRFADRGRAIDVGVVAGWIDAVEPAGSGMHGAIEIDAAGLEILPAMVDVAPVLLDGAGGGWRELSGAASAGGIATLVAGAAESGSLTQREGVQAALDAARSSSSIGAALLADALPESLHVKSGGFDLAVGIAVALADPRTHRPRIADSVLCALFMWAAHRGALLVARPPLAGADAKRPPRLEIAGCERLLALAEQYGVRLLLAPITCAGAVDAVEDARRRGVTVAAATTAIHLRFDAESDADVPGLDPPLRSALDRERLLDAARAGAIELLISGSRAGAPAFAAHWPAIADLVARGDLAPARVIDLCCGAAATLFRLPGPPAIAPGAAADLLLVRGREVAALVAGGRVAFRL